MSGVLWDIGTGSGSIGIEAARICPDLEVYGVERQLTEIDNIKQNILRHRVYNLRPVLGEAPEVLPGLAAPARVFVGGRIVVNSVTERTTMEAPLLLARQGA